MEGHLQASMEVWVDNNNNVTAGYCALDNFNQDMNDTMNFIEFILNFLFFMQIHV